MNERISEIGRMYKKAEYYDSNVLSVLGFIKEVDLDGNRMTVTTNQDRVLEVTPKAENQILERLKIKGILKDYNKFDKDIKETEINHAFDNGIKQAKRKIKYTKDGKYKYPHQFIINNQTDELLGFMGNGYKRISNLTVLKEAEKVYGSDLDGRFTYFDNTEVRMNLHFKSEQVQTTALSNNKITFTFNVSNNETWGYSLKVSGGLIFMSCSNGLILDEIADHTRIVHRQPTLGEMKDKLKFALSDHLENPKVLERIDNWAFKPPMFETLNSDETQTKLDKLLTQFGITKEDYRRKIYKILRDPNYLYADLPLNSFAIGSATNDFASNHMDNPIEAHNLIVSAYSIMNIQ